MTYYEISVIYNDEVGVDVVLDLDSAQRATIEMLRKAVTVEPWKMEITELQRVKNDG